MLATKLAVPHVRPDLLPRPHLLARLDEACARPLTLICTPAGFGKTTLLAAWAGGDRSVAWLSLDGGDNDPARFWRYLIAALQRVHPGLGAHVLPLTGGSGRPPDEAFVTALINAVAALADDIVLVLDDYHLIESQPVHEGLAYLIQHLPPRLHLVIAGRSDPSLPLAGLRARGRLAELRAADLRFAPAEVTGFFRDVWGITLPPAAVAAIEERTEGWAAGLQLAALSLRDQPDPDAFIASFTGSHRFVLDYLSEEVLARLPEHVRAFLLETSVLERLCGPLCDAVTGRDDGQQMLDSLERANLFTLPLDEHRRWYRYHHLFADLLRIRLGQDRPRASAELHRRAAAWCEAQGLLDDAVHHALAAGDARWAVRLVEGSMEELIWWRGEGATLSKWLAMLPVDIARDRPRLSLARAVQSLVLGRLSDAATLLAIAEHAPDHPTEPYEPTVGRSLSILANVPPAMAFIRTSLAVLRGEAADATASAHQALAQLSDDDHQLRALVQVLPGEAAWLAGRLPEAETMFEGVIAARQADGLPQMATRALADLGKVQQARGRLRAAAQTYQRGLSLLAPPGRPPAPAALLQLLGLAEVLRQQGDLDGALQHATVGVDMSRLFFSTQATANGLATLAWIWQALGDTPGARAAMDDAARNVPSDEVVTLFLPAPAERARWLIAQGQIDEVDRWASSRGLSEDDPPSYPHERDHLVLARLLLARGAPRRALPLLARIGDDAAAGGRFGSLIEVRALQALALEAADEPQRALATLGEALSLARPERYVRVFADEGTPMAALLRRFVASARRGLTPDPGGPLLDYAARLLTAFPDEDAAKSPSAGANAPAATVLVEPLTEREREVLQLLASGKANREIAAELVVTLDTVKKHLTHIFGKLGAASRTQAIARARELGLLT